MDEIHSLVANYLIMNPPTVGHGYSHFRKVAEKAKGLAVRNNFPKPEIAYLCGLLHDLYRPAEGKAGQEDHEKLAADAAKTIIKETKYSDQAGEICLAIVDHDKKIIDGEPNQLMEILSIADKSNMNFQRAMSYTWQSNRFLESEGRGVFTNFKETIRDFSAYQVKAWRVFLKVRIAGNDDAVRAYIQMNRDLLNAVENELGGRGTFEGVLKQMATAEAELDREYMIMDGIGEANMKLIMRNYAGLI